MLSELQLVHEHQRYGSGAQSCVKKFFVLAFATKWTFYLAEGMDGGIYFAGPYIGHFNA